MSRKGFNSKMKNKMVKLTKEEVEHVAKLARLGLTEKEKKKFQKQLSSILNYVSQLNEVETKDVEPIAQITGLFNVTREDKVKPSTSRNKLLKNAPAKQNGYLKTKRILE